jgi:hypothetical protein
MNAGDYQGKTWWVVTNLKPDPCCNAPCVATNGEDAICQTCGWESDYDDLQQYLDSDNADRGGGTDAE